MTEYATHSNENLPFLVPIGKGYIDGNDIASMDNINHSAMTRYAPRTASHAFPEQLETQNQHNHYQNQQKYNTFNQLYQFDSQPKIHHSRASTRSRRSGSLGTQSYSFFQNPITHDSNDAPYQIHPSEYYPYEYPVPQELQVPNRAKSMRSVKSANLPGANVNRTRSVSCSHNPQQGLYHKHSEWDSKNRLSSMTRANTRDISIPSISRRRSKSAFSSRSIRKTELPQSISRIRDLTYDVINAKMNNISPNEVKILLFLFEAIAIIGALHLLLKFIQLMENSYALYIIGIGITCCFLLEQLHKPRHQVRTRSKSTSR